MLPYLLKPNHRYQVKITVVDNVTRYYLDDTLYFEYRDDNVLNEGYFGFRSTYSHHIIDNFNVYQLVCDWLQYKVISAAPKHNSQPQQKMSR